MKLVIYFLFQINSCIILHILPAKVVAQTNKKIQQFQIGRYLGTDQLDNIHSHALQPIPQDNKEEARFS